MNRQEAMNRPIRVVVFSSGPVLEPDMKQFLIRLEAHPDITLLGVLCQARFERPRGMVRDVWRRRGWMAVPLLGLDWMRTLRRWLCRPRTEIRLRKKYSRLKDRLWMVADVHAETVLRQVRELNPDLGLSYGSPILKPSLFDIPGCGTLGIHHGQVPAYRGKKTTFWAMYHGEPVAGVTIQRISSGLDTGAIVNQGVVPAQGRSYGRVWRDLAELGVNLFVDSVLQVRAGTAVYHPQPGPEGKLYRDPKPPDIVRFWLRQIRRRWNSTF